MKQLAFLVLVGVMCQARHIHPGHILENDIIFEDLNTEDTPVDILHLKQTRFVPLNRESFFKTYEPCEDGFKRDALGICREVWD
ncbi:unnamed protein product, partial [Brenthis ino]